MIVPVAWLRRLQRVEGQDAVEYGFLIVVVALVAAATTSPFRAAVAAWVGAIAGALPPV